MEEQEEEEQLEEWEQLEEEQEEEWEEGQQQEEEPNASRATEVIRDGTGSWLPFPSYQELFPPYGIQAVLTEVSGLFQ